MPEEGTGERGVELRPARDDDGPHRVGGVEAGNFIGRGDRGQGQA